MVEEVERENLAKINEIKDDCKSQVQKLEKNNDKLVIENEALTIELENLKSEHETLKKELASSKSKILELKNQKLHLEKELGNVKDEENIRILELTLAKVN